LAVGHRDGQASRNHFGTMQSFHLEMILASSGTPIRV
jgi:hypothetical protein